MPGDTEIIKPRSFIRLIIDRELSDDEMQEFHEIVTDHVESEDMIGYNDSADSFVSPEILYYQEDKWHFYEILTKDNISRDDGDNISEELATVFSDDFEIEATYI